MIVYLGLHFLMWMKIVWLIGCDIHLARQSGQPSDRILNLAMAASVSFAIWTVILLWEALS